jgi:UDP-N-acetylglucosamine--N-acetylmuramyl-(pentapeptide) pyrophosphoryl-undecaprenol N-acetylglucosamine transferase
MAGGTGGHIMPGMAVAEHLRAQGWNIAWMGNAEGMEAKLTAGKGYEMAWVRFSALARQGLAAQTAAALQPAARIRQAWQQLGRIRPDVVLGMGGYVSFPGGMMAVLRGIPLLLHEQNSVAGLANRVLAGVADKVMTGFPGCSAQGAMGRQSGASRNRRAASADSQICRTRWTAAAAGRWRQPRRTGA